MSINLFSVRQVADRLGVKWYRIKYAHCAGLVAEPMRVARTGFKTRVDVAPAA
jgi:hypothetical protein